MINRNSYNRSFCGKNATAYSQGVYFAVNADYSMSDTYFRPDEQGNKYMNLARVLGEFCKGDSSMRTPPPQTSQSGLLPLSPSPSLSPSLTLSLCLLPSPLPSVSFFLSPCTRISLDHVARDEFRDSTFAIANCKNKNKTPPYYTSLAFAPQTLP